MSASESHATLGNRYIYVQSNCTSLHAVRSNHRNTHAMHPLSIHSIKSPINLYKITKKERVKKKKGKKTVYTRTEASTYLRASQCSPRSFKYTITRSSLDPTDAAARAASANSRQHLHVIQFLASVKADIPRESGKDEAELLLNFGKNPLARLQQAEISACICRPNQPTPKKQNRKRERKGESKRDGNKQA